MGGCLVSDSWSLWMTTVSILACLSLHVGVLFSRKCVPRNGILVSSRIPEFHVSVGATRLLPAVCESLLFSIATAAMHVRIIFHFDSLMGIKWYLISTLICICLYLELIFIFLGFWICSLNWIFSFSLELLVFSKKIRIDINPLPVVHKHFSGWSVEYAYRVSSPN